MRPENTPIRRFDHLMGEVNAIYHEMSVRLGLSDSVSMILYTLVCEGGSARISDICCLTGMSRQTVHSALTKMQSQGYLALRSADRRSKCAQLTESGQLYAQKTAAKILEAENRVFDGWSPEDVQQYLELAARFRDDLRGKAEEILQET